MVCVCMRERERDFQAWKAGRGCTILCLYHVPVDGLLSWEEGEGDTVGFADTSPVLAPKGSPSSPGNRCTILILPLLTFPNASRTTRRRSRNWCRQYNHATVASPQNPSTAEPAARLASRCPRNRTPPYTSPPTTPTIILSLKQGTFRTASNPPNDTAAADDAAVGSCG